MWTKKAPHPPPEAGKFFNEHIAHMPLTKTAEWLCRQRAIFMNNDSLFAQTLIIPRSSTGRFDLEWIMEGDMTIWCHRLCLLLHVRDEASFLRYFWDGCLSRCNCFCCRKVFAGCCLSFVFPHVKQLTPTFVDSIRQPCSRVWDSCWIFTATEQFVTICIETWCLDKTDWIKIQNWLALKLI